MNYLAEPRGTAVQFGAYQDLGAEPESEKVWKLWQASKFDKAVEYTATLSLQERRNVVGFLRKNGVVDKEIEAFQAAVKVARANAGKSTPETTASGKTNYLFWGGLALAAAGGAYLLFFRKKGKRQ